MCHNELYGNVPNELGNLSQLMKLTLEGNQLVGDMPAAVCDLTTSTLTELVADCEEISCPCCHKCCTDGGGCQWNLGTP